MKPLPPLPRVIRDGEIPPYPRVRFHTEPYTAATKAAINRAFEIAEMEKKVNQQPSWLQRWGYWIMACVMFALLVASTWRH